jgi:hypothetical protein
MNKPVKRKNTGKYEASLKIAIAREYLSSDLGFRALGVKYNIPWTSIRSIIKWYQQRYPDGVAELPAVAECGKAIDESSLKITALEMLIENASKELGIDLVKKFGTKQPPK